MKKKVTIILVAIILLVLLFPIRNQLKDGGSIEYNAILYKVTKYHQIDKHSFTGYKEGIEIKVLNLTIFKKMKNEKEPNEDATTKNKKQIIKLDRFDDLGETASDFSEIPYKIESNTGLNETLTKRYENESYLDKYVKIVKDKFGVKIDNKWKYYIHYYSEEEKSGFLVFQYYIGEIKTNKTIMFPLHNGKVSEIYYNYLDITTNEDVLISKLNKFKETYIQEKKEDYQENEKFLEDKVEYNYYFQSNMLVYVYTLFYENSSGTINNDHGSVIIID